MIQRGISEQDFSGISFPTAASKLKRIKTPFSPQKDGVCFYHTPKLTAYDCLRFRRFFENAPVAATARFQNDFRTRALHRDVIISAIIVGYFKKVGYPVTGIIFLQTGLEGHRQIQ